MKTPKSFRLHTSTSESLERLSELTGESQAALIEKAIFNLERELNDDARRFMLLYEQVSENIQYLEITRDHERELTPDEQQVYDFYNELWDRLRELPFFHETRPDAYGEH